jgi:hypothetical protein
MIRGRRAATTVALALLLATGACAGGEQAATSTSAAVTTTAAGTTSSTAAEAVTTTSAATTTTVAGSSGEDGTENPGWIISLLGRIPDTEASGHYVELVDLAAAAQAAGVEIPPPGAQASEVTNSLLALPQDALVPELLQRAATSVDDIRAELGIDPVTIQRAVTAGESPEQYLVLQGDFDEGAIDSAVRSEPVWSDLLATAEHSGVSYYTWGEDFTSMLDRVTTARPLGRGGRLALDGGYLYWVPWTAGVEALIDAGAGSAPSLTDRPLMRQAAELLEGEHVYSALLTDVPLIAEPLGAQPGEGVAGYLAPYLVLGLGGGRDDQGAFWVVVAIHDSAAAAEQSAAGFRVGIEQGTAVGLGGAPWSERVTEAAVTVEGEAMVAVLRSAGSPGDWVRAYWSRDPLLAVAGG